MKISKNQHHKNLSMISRLAFILILAIGLARPAQAQSPAEIDEVVTALSNGATVRVIVALHEGEAVGQQLVQAQQAVLDQLSDQEFRPIHQFETLPGLVGQVDEQGLAKLLDQPEVAAVALDLPVEATFADNATLINVDAVFNGFGLTGAGVNVAVLDTGIDSTHPDLTARIVAQHCFSRSDCPSTGAAESDNAQDENGHGSHVAGIIASQGTTSPRGLAAGAGLVAVRVLGRNGSGFTSDVLAGLDWVVANQDQFNIKIINLSLGGGSYAGLCDQVDANTMLYAAAVDRARQAGITVFAAAGNHGEPEMIMAPACVSGVVAVGNIYHAGVGRLSWPVCVDETTTADQVACSSNSSAALDLLAPGVLIESTNLGGGQSRKSGTSMSTPHAAGVAALMLQARAELGPDEIERILKESGVPVTDARNGRVAPRLDALAAISQIIGSDVDILAGTVLLEGRPDHSGVRIILSETDCSSPISPTLVATTTLEGRFEIIRSANQTHPCLWAVKPGYLAGQRQNPAGNLGTITLPGGDITGDGRIDIFDLAFIAARYGGHDPAADITGDQLVNIFDLVIAAANYNQAGVVSDWE